MHEIVIAVLDVDAQLIMKQRRTAVQIESLAMEHLPLICVTMDR